MRLEGSRFGSSACGPAGKNASNIKPIKLGGFGFGFG